MNAGAGGCGTGAVEAAHDIFLRRRPPNSIEDRHTVEVVAPTTDLASRDCEHRDVPGAFTASAPTPARDTDQSIVGPPEHWAAVLTHLPLDLGSGTFVLIAPPDPDVLRTFIEDVAPDVRERVAAARSQAEPATATAAGLSQ
jgi:alkanesulfonate monooxygenase SsuD/methylene tetrahydromethanopterin reductase-like flavin-dependent oxidoreductase (luciferase family)